MSTGACYTVGSHVSLLSGRYDTTYLHTLCSKVVIRRRIRNIANQLVFN